MSIPVSSLIALRALLVGRSVHAGFPSPADDFIKEMIGLNQVLVQNPIVWPAPPCGSAPTICPGDGRKADHALTLKPDHPMGSGHHIDSQTD
jgi:DNA polymerase V